MCRNLKLLHMWENFRILHICHAQKSEIYPNDKFVLHRHICGICDKYIYEVCIYISILYGDNNDPNLPSTETSLDELLVGESGCADKASLSKVCLESESENETDISKVSIV